MIVDCMTCPVRGQQCDDCVVTVLLDPTKCEATTETASAGTTTETVPAGTLFLDAAESRAVSMFVSAGLVNAQAVAGLQARRESGQHWIPVHAVG